MTNVENVCKIEKEFCNTCSSHFAKIRPRIKDVIITKHFERDLKNEEEMNGIIKDVLDCSHINFHELHKFEENIDGILLFRARKENLHILYSESEHKTLEFTLLDYVKQLFKTDIIKFINGEYRLYLIDSIK